MNTLARNSKKPRLADPNPSSAQFAFDFMHGQIVAGKWTAETFVNERLIASALKLSRTPVREAMNRLEGQGFLKRSGRSFIVNSLRIEDILEILSLRLLLEVEATRLAVGRIPKAQLREIKNAVKSMQRAEALSSEDHWKTDDLIHLSIAEASGNKQLVRILSDLRARTRMFGLHRIPDRFEPGKREHLQILTSLEAEDSAGAQEAMRAHITNAKDSILKSLAAR